MECPILKVAAGEVFVGAKRSGVVLECAGRFYARVNGAKAAGASAREAAVKAFVASEWKILKPIVMEAAAKAESECAVMVHSMRERGIIGA